MRTWGQLSLGLEVLLAWSQPTLYGSVGACAWPYTGRLRRAILNVRDYPTYEPLRIALGQTRRFAERINLNVMLPRNEFASSGYCLANPGVEYLVYVPDDDRVDVYLGIAPERFHVEWLNVLSGETRSGEPIIGGGNRHFTSPFGLESVLYLYR